MAFQGENLPPVHQGDIGDSYIRMFFTDDDLATIELQPADPGFHREVDACAYQCANGEAHDVQTHSSVASDEADVPNGASCTVTEEHTPTPPKNQRKGKRDVNNSPCAICQSQQKGCVVIQENPRLCALCEKKGRTECPPHIHKKGKANNAEASGTYVPTEKTPGCGVIKF